jgi:hypothetical protein
MSVKAQIERTDQELRDEYWEKFKSWPTSLELAFYRKNGRPHGDSPAGRGDLFPGVQAAVPARRSVRPGTFSPPPPPAKPVEGVRDPAEPEERQPARFALDVDESIGVSADQFEAAIDPYGPATRAEVLAALHEKEGHQRVMEAGERVDRLVDTTGKAGHNDRVRKDETGSTPTTEGNTMTQTGTAVVTDPPAALPGGPEGPAIEPVAAAIEIFQAAGKKQITAALIKVQQSITDVARDKENPHFKHRYADINAIMNAVKGPLGENGIAVTQAMEYRGGGAGWIMVTTLLHTSGEFLVGTFPVHPKDDTPQGWGSAQTYARRYGLVAIAGVTVGEQDDDGNGGSGRGDGAARAAEPVRQPVAAEPPRQVAQPPAERPAPKQDPHGPASPPPPAPRTAKEPPARPEGTPASEKQVNYIKTLCDERGTTIEQLRAEHKMTYDGELLKAHATFLIGKLVGVGART